MLEQALYKSNAKVDRLGIVYEGWPVHHFTSSLGSQLPGQLLGPANVKDDQGHMRNIELAQTGYCLVMLTTNIKNVTSVKHTCQFISARQTGSNSTPRNQLSNFGHFLK